jgi:hypothetical protein
MRDYKKPRYRYNWKEEKWEYYDPFAMEESASAIASFSPSFSFLRNNHLISTPWQKVKLETTE